MPEVSLIKLQEPRIQERRALLVTGLEGRYSKQTVDQIPAQWKRLPIDRIPGQLGHMAYGVVYNVDSGTGEFDYLAGVEVAGVSPKLADYKSLKIPAQMYAIFCHRGHVSQLKDTIEAIWKTWLPSSGRQVAEAKRDMPCLIEWYGYNFDPGTGLGDMEVWLPVRG